MLISPQIVNCLLPVYNTTQLTTSSICLFVVVFMLIAVIIYGAKYNQGSLNWSYAFAVIGTIFALVASILGLVQMKKSNVA